MDAAGVATTLAPRAAIYRLAMARITGEPGAGDLNRALASVARQTIELLGGPDADRMEGGGAEDRTRTYLDLSCRGDRRWCGMRECGNRAKASAYRRRRATSA